MPNCDFGRYPCSCRECTESERTYAEKERKSILENNPLCLCGEKSENVVAWTAKCHKCTNEANQYCEEYKAQEKQLWKEKELTRTLARERIMRVGVVELVRIAEAVTQYRRQTSISNSDAWIKRQLISNFKEMLHVVKKGNRWMVSADRLKGCDFYMF